jgi:hypothetical protein
LGFALSGCAPKSSASNAANPTPAADPWAITDNRAASANYGLLWNGLLGLRFLPRGDREIYAIQNYGKTGEEKIRKWADQTAAMIMVGDTFMHPVAGSNFRQSIDLKTGICEMQWDGRDDTAGRFFVKGRLAISPTKAIVQEVWTITTERTCSISVSRSRADAGRPRAIKGRFQNEYDLNANGKKLLVRERLDGSSTNGWNPDEGYSWQGKVGARTPLTFQRIVLDPSAVEVTASTIDVEAEAKAHWAKAWQTDIQIDGPVEDQQFVRSALFYLRSSIHPDGKMSVSPMGLSSDLYGGHVFWDADIWVFPALALIDPERALAIPKYRTVRSRQAYQNFFKWAYDDGRPTGNGHVDTPFRSGRPYNGRKFPWESSVSGKETVPGPSKFQDHITGSVAFSMNQAAALGLLDSKSMDEIKIGSQVFYWLRSVKNQQGFWELHDTMSPDENHTGDNDLYTNLLAMWCQSGGKWPAKPTYKLPKDSQTFLTYDNDGLRGYKQAAAVLSIWPLQYPPAQAQAKAMMERFADKVTKNGPAMSDSVHALIWARLGEKEKAYAAWHASWKPFVKPPFLLFSEKRSSSRTYFTTGAAGSLNAVLYGFAGIRIDDKKAPGAQWSTPLKNGKVLSIAPNLPKEWKKLTLKNLTILGKRYTFEIEADRVKVS